MLPRFSESATPPSRHFFEALAWQASTPAHEGGFGLRLPASASLRRDGPPTQELATVARSRGGFDESTPTQGSAMATSPRQALRPPPGHKRSDLGPQQAPATLCAPPPYPPTSSLFGSSNSRHSPLFALNFPFNYYKAINKDSQSPSCCPGSASLPPRPADTSSKLWLGKPPLLRRVQRLWPATSNTLATPSSQ